MWLNEIKDHSNLELRMTDGIQEGFSQTRIALIAQDNKKGRPAGVDEPQPGINLPAYSLCDRHDGPPAGREVGAESSPDAKRTSGG
jgi:hypothetical protein